MPAASISGHVFIATSLDGYIARPGGAIDWLTEYATGDEDTGYHAFMDSIDGIVMGRHTFELACSFTVWPFPKPVVVLSQTLSQGDLSANLTAKARVSRLAPAPLLASLSADGWRRVYVDGGKVIQSFLKARLISDIVLTRVPILLGSGISLFGSIDSDVRLRHVRTTAFASGLVQSTYEFPDNTTL